MRPVNPAPYGPGWLNMLSTGGQVVARRSPPMPASATYSAPSGPKCRWRGLVSPVATVLTPAWAGAASVTITATVTMANKVFIDRSWDRETRAADAMAGREGGASVE
jgi:hypothetical protein